MKRAQRSRDPIYSTQRGLVVGAGIGLYMGIFFRPSREPDLGFVIGLILFATLMTIIFRVMRGTIARANIVREGARSLALYTFSLLALEGRHYVLLTAGPIAVVLFTTALGTLTGYIWVQFGGSVRNVGEIDPDTQGR